MKFLCDEMCGDINRWLRMLGYDSTSPQDHPNQDDSTPNDDEIIEICLSTYRILISKDYEIIKKMKMKTEKNLKSNQEFTSRFISSPTTQNGNKNCIFPCLLLRSTEIIDNLAMISNNFNIRLGYDINNARCPKCNGNLCSIRNPEEFKRQIPPSVFNYHSEFWKCDNSDCQQLFWKGTHLERIKKTLEDVKIKITKKY